MANKTVSNLNELTTVSNNDVLLVETATETLKVTKGNLLKEVNEQLNAKSNASHTHDEYVTENELNSKGLATETFVTNKIAEASLSGGDVDLSGYATVDFVTQEISNKGLSEDSVHFSHLSEELKSMYVTRQTSSLSDAKSTSYIKKANLKFTATKNAGWVQVRIPLDLTSYPDGDVTINIDSYWKSKDGSTVQDGTTFYNTVYTCADDGSTQIEPTAIKDFPTLKTFSNNEAYYSGSVTFKKTSNTKYVNIYTIPKGNASVVPHNAELGVSLRINGEKLTRFEFKEGMIGDEVEVSYIGASADDIPSTPDGLYMDGNFVDVNGYLLPDVIDTLMNNIGTGNGNPSTPSHQWKGKKANFLGDSITHGVGTTRTYHQYLQSSLSLVASRNYGISGSSITDRNTPMHSRCLTMDDDADIVFVFGGTNDFFFAVPLGEWYTLSGTTRNLNKDTTTFKGALNTLCCNLINKYPSKQIILMTPLHRNTFGEQPTEYQTNSIGLYVEDYVNCVIEAGKIHSIPVIDLYSESGLRPSESASCNLYFTSGDKLHPTATGHERIAKLIESKLKIIPVL